MHLFVPILAQVVTLGVHDGAEARYVIDRDERYFESSNDTNGRAELSWTWKRSSLTLGYSPSLTVVPLEETPRDVTLYHNAHITGEHRWRLTTLSVGVSVGYGDRDLRREALGQGQTTPVTPPPEQPPGQTPPGQTPPGQTPPGQMPPPDTSPTQPGGTTGQGKNPTTPAVLGIARLASLHVGSNLSHQLGRGTSFGAFAGYTLSGGVDDASRAAYPVLPSTDAGVSLAYQVDPRNTLTTGLSNQFAWGEDDTTTYLAVLSESWLHKFTRRTNGSVGAGVAYSRTAEPNFPTLHTIYPVGNASIATLTHLARGTLAAGAGLSTAPVLDLTTGAVDPQLGIGAGGGWSRDRFSISAGYASHLSLSGGEEGALSSITANAGVAYDLGAGFSLSAGVREAWQRFEGITLIEPTTSFYGGVSWSGDVELNRPRKP